MKTGILIKILIFLPILVLFISTGFFLSKVPKPVPELKLPKFSFGEPPEVPPSGTVAKPWDDKIIPGWKIYNEKGCFFCHGIEGKGGIKNPNAKGGKISPLQSVAEGYTKEELKELILRGTRDIAKEDPGGPNPPLNMPGLRGLLTDNELDSLSEYLMSLMPKKKEDEW